MPEDTALSYTSGRSEKENRSNIGSTAIIETTYKPFGYHDLYAGNWIAIVGAEEQTNMLWYAWVFLVIAIIAAIFGFGGIAGAAVGIAKILFVIFIILFVIGLIVGRRSI